VESGACAASGVAKIPAIRRNACRMAHFLVQMETEMPATNM
jgi:hypothetical protein